MNLTRTVLRRPVTTVLCVVDYEFKTGTDAGDGNAHDGYQHLVCGGKSGGYQ